MNLGRAVGLALALAACGSDAPKADAPEVSARVLVHIDADEGVALATAALRVELLPLSALPTPTAPIDALIAPTRSLLYQAFTWPVDLELPEDLLEAAPAFWIEASALDVSGRVLTTARLITNQREGRLMEPTLLLSAPCLDIICGSRMSTCSTEGFCGSSIRAAEGFPSTPLP